MNMEVREQTFSTLIDLLRFRATQQPDQTAYTFLEDGENQVLNLTYGELDQKAKVIAAQLQAKTVAGDRVLLLYHAGLDYISAFFGCLYAGVIAVPAYPPRNNHSFSRLQAIINNAQSTTTLSTASILANISRKDGQLNRLQQLLWLATDEIPDELDRAWCHPKVQGDTLAFLQYTSGSTGAPKGVMVSHGNLLHNQALIQHAMGHSQQTIFVGWLPLFHDMGLIGNMLQPLYLGIPCTFMAPVSFLQKPLHWLQAISKYRATTSGAPNFAYDLCVRKITDEQRASLDLSSWEVAFTGAEPVRAQTLDRFTVAFEPYGFRREAFYPCYGMAETTLIVSGGSQAQLPVLKSVQASELQKDRVRSADERAGEKAEDTQVLVGCGKPILDLQVVIADPKTSVQCQPGQVGEIWVKGGSVAQGYWQQVEATQQSFHAYLKNIHEGPFLRTGDLGFLDDNELFITGRLKDLVIIRGRNHYPQDIELTVFQSHPALREECGAAFSVEVGEVERLVIVQEVERSHIRKLDQDEVIGAIRMAIAEHHDLNAYAIVLLKTGRLPKTSSGKVQRQACRTQFLSGTLTSINPHVEADSHQSNMTDYSVTQNQSISIPDRSYRGNQNNRSKNKSSTIQSVENPVSNDSLSKNRRRDYVLEDLGNYIAHLLKINVGEIDFYTHLTKLGIDSLMAIDFMTFIEETYDVKIGVDQLFGELTTLNTLASFIGSKRSSSPVTHGQLDNTEPSIRQTMQPAVETTSNQARRLEFIGERGKGTSETSFARIVHSQLKVMSEINQAISTHIDDLKEILDEE